MPAFGLSINDARRAIGIGRTKLYDLINAGEIDAFKIGRRTLVEPESVRRFVDRLLSAGPSPR